MEDEIYDVVNQYDEVIGQATRGEIHRAGLKHRAVHIFVFNSAGQIFLQKRSQKKDKAPGSWDSSASGHLDCGEDYDDCAVRELKEELGIEPPEPPQRVFKINACPETDQEFVWVYKCYYDGDFKLNKDEIDEGKWVTPQELTEWIKQRPKEFSPAFIAIWNIWTKEINLW